MSTNPIGRDNYTPDRATGSMGGETIESASIDLKADVQEAVAPVTEALAQAINEQKGAGADRLQTIANAINDAAPSFDKDMPQVAAYIREAGAWVEHSASDIRGQKFDVLVKSVGRFARTQPVAAFGVAALSGFLLSRFLKSSRPLPVPIQSSSPATH